MERFKKSNRTILFGYGYKDKIPAMNIEERQGIDLKNENVHNNFVNILAREVFFNFLYS